LPGVTGRRISGRSVLLARRVPRAEARPAGREAGLRLPRHRIRFRCTARCRRPTATPKTTRSTPAPASNGPDGAHAARLGSTRRECGAPGGLGRAQAVELGQDRRGLALRRAGHEARQSRYPITWPATRARTRASRMAARATFFSSSSSCRRSGGSGRNVRPRRSRPRSGHSTNTSAGCSR